MNKRKQITLKKKKEEKKRKQITLSWMLLTEVTRGEVGKTSLHESMRQHSNKMRDKWIERKQGGMWRTKEKISW